MRAVDGAVVLVDAVEGTMPQTETVLRAGAQGQVRPVLFINKVDCLINEVKVDEMEMHIRLGKVIDKVNKLIKGMNEESYKNGWKLDASLNNGSIRLRPLQLGGLGSVHEAAGSFKEVYNRCRSGVYEIRLNNSPSEVLLDMVVRHLPNPVDAQKRRIGAIWHGDKETKEGNRC